MPATPLHIAGHRLLLDPAGALYWPAQHLLAVADLHLEKGSAAAGRGSLVPPWDTRATLDRLAALLRRYRPRVFVALGDTFHDRAAAHRMAPDDAARLASLTAGLAAVWVRGNHDPDPPSLPGAAVPDLVMKPFVFRHMAAARPAEGAEICGHHHPKARIATGPAAVSRPCFVADATRLLLPAFGTYTGGLDVAHPAIAGLFPRGGRVFLLGRDRLFSFPFARPAKPSALAGQQR